MVQLDVKQAVDHAGTSSSFQGDEIVKLVPFLDCFDCSDLEWKLLGGALGNGVLEQSADESWTVSRRTVDSDHNDHGTGVQGFGQEVEISKIGMDSGPLCAGRDLLRRRCGCGSSVGCCAEVMVAEVI